MAGRFSRVRHFVAVALGSWLGEADLAARRSRGSGAWLGLGARCGAAGARGRRAPGQE